MKISVTKSLGMVCLSAWLILTGLVAFDLILPPIVMSILALAAGIFILIGR